MWSIPRIRRLSKGKNTTSVQTKPEKNQVASLLDSTEQKISESKDAVSNLIHNQTDTSSTEKKGQDEAKDNLPCEVKDAPEVQTDDKELFRIKSTFPFQLFPDELVIKQKSVSVVRNNLLTSYTETMLVKDIGLVSINDGVVFASMVISYKAPMDHVQIDHLIPGKAFQVKSMIEKLIIKKSEDGGGSEQKKPLDESAMLSPQGEHHEA